MEELARWTRVSPSYDDCIVSVDAEYCMGHGSIYCVHGCIFFGWDISIISGRNSPSSHRTLSSTSNVFLDCIVEARAASIHLQVILLASEKRIYTWERYSVYSSLENTSCPLDLLESPSNMFQKQPKYQKC
jgi:hypothetical protein